MSKRPTRPEADRRMVRNAGYQPDHSIGRRVRVILANGRPGATDPNPMSPPGWSADSCDWSFHTMPDGSPYPFDIAEFEVI